MMLAYIAYALLAITLVAGLIRLVSAMDWGVGAVIWLYFAAVTAFVVGPLHGFLAWWALVTIPPLAAAGIGMLNELWCVFHDRHDVEPAGDLPVPKKSSTRFKDYEHAWDHIGCRHPALIVCEATQVKKMAVLMYFGWNLIEVAEADHGYHVQLQRGTDSKQLLILKPEQTRGVVKEAVVAPLLSNLGVGICESIQLVG